MRSKLFLHVLIKILAMTFWTSMFLLTPAAMAVVIGKGNHLAPFSEPAAMVILGTSLLGLAGFWRKRVREKRD